MGNNGLFSLVTSFLLIRHGETDVNLQGRSCGWTDIPLNEKGKWQAERLAERIGNEQLGITAIYSSDLSRAKETAAPTAKALGLPVLLSKELREINWGQGEGLTKAEWNALYGDHFKALLEQYPVLSERWDHALFPEAESYNGLIDRITAELRSIAASHPNETVAIFTHGRVLKTLIGKALNTEEFPYPGNCKIAYFTLNGSAPDAQLHFIRIEEGL